ncbi:type IV pilus biogenesis/stability protein PilW [Chromatiaceae bacterium AAb-1]|nr:type IV pilus biogenesis/stability protein PilW [Chromatiaceae bacterium AAb-1]
MPKNCVAVVVLWLGTVLLTACVSEQSYIGSQLNTPVNQADYSAAARTRITLGLNYLQRGDTVQAKYNLERAAEQAPALPEVHTALAWYFQQAGELQQAEDSYRRALHHGPDNGDVNHNYGTFLCQQQQFDKAEALLRKAINAPGYLKVAESYENLALCALQQQQFEHASEYLHSSLAHNLRSSAVLNLATVHYAMGNEPAAQELLDKLPQPSARSLLLSRLVAGRQQQPELARMAEQQLLHGYADSDEAVLLRQQQLDNSEFEKLRRQYLQQQTE